MSPTFHLPEIFREDADRFREEIARLNSGAVSAAEFRSFRVPLGVYEQREADTYMLRVRFPGGGVTPPQMHTLAEVARQCGNGVLHVTTRQDIQVHRVLLNDVPAAFERLFAAGLSTRGGGGNTVRNIVGCPNAGVCRGEVFDPSGHVAALTEFLLPDPLSYQLPRKYKIAFSGCDNDCAGATVNDLGFIAKRRNGDLGFAAYVGGGMGAASRVADRFEDFVPAQQAHYVAEAIKRVFDKHGNRKNRNKARLRFLIEKIGLDDFRKLYDAEMAELRKDGLPKLNIRDIAAERSAAPGRSSGGEGFADWRRRFVTPQKQDGFFLVEIPLWLGDIPADTLEKLADVVERFGEPMARTTQSQNLVLRWIGESELGDLHAELAALGLAAAEPAVLGTMVACTGAATCRLGICLSRGLAGAIRRALEQSNVDLDSLTGLKIHISGCPNSCGRHPVGDIGLFGAARRVGGRLVPHYILQLGGVVAEGKTRLAHGNHTIPARNVPALVVDLLGEFARSDACPDFSRFLEERGEAFVDEIAARHAEVPDFEDDKNYYFDWGGDELFSLAGRGPGECGAGVFDMIEVDLAGARGAADQGRLFDAVVLAARSLLVTRGQQARDESEVLRLFTRYFLDEQLVDDSLRAIVDSARQAANTPAPGEAFAPEPADVSQFVEAVQMLYDNMDPSLRFKPAAKTSSPPAAAEPDSPEEADRRADFRGVVCPLNYVKTNMVLAQMQSGQVLSVLLDEPGMRNVPESVKNDGHEVLSVVQEGQQWRVRIRKR